MNILLGICGFGNGHVAREADVIRALLQRGHNLALFVFLNSQKYVAKHFPDIPAFEISVPIIHVAKPYGVDFGRTADEAFNVPDDSTRVNYRAMQAALDYFGGKPDLILSDYELVAAQLAYALDVPLATIDQQSKFAGFQLSSINSYERIEEKGRLGMFFPKAAVRYATSFFEIPWESDARYPVELIPPILREEIFSLRPTHTTDKQITVYFSPHVKLGQSWEEIQAILKKISDWQFHVFQRRPADDAHNIHYHGFDTQNFLQRIQASAGVITNGGHNLLSELAYLKKPVFTMPGDTYDQQFCSYIIADNHLGIASETMTPNDMRQFLDNLPRFSENMNARQGLVKRFDGLDVLMADLQRRFGV